MRGPTLADLIEAGALSDRDVAADRHRAQRSALEHAHGRGVVHRDVKPANVIVPERPAGESALAKLTDFGVAVIAGDDGLTRTGDVVGTLAYMAPEQAEGRRVDGAADLYSLALVLYEALSGVNPVRAQGAAATARRVGMRLPSLARLRPDLGPELCEALDRALLPAPEDRGTLDELRERARVRRATARRRDVGHVDAADFDRASRRDATPTAPEYGAARPASTAAPSARTARGARCAGTSGRRAAPRARRRR